jgi:hypothetical protein
VSPQDNFPGLLPARSMAVRRDLLSGSSADGL